MNDVLFSCDRVSRTFGSGNRAVVALHDVTCTAASGARIAVVGPSGSGKSTLIHLLAGLDEPTRGSVSWPGLGGHPRDDPALVGVVFQGQSLIPGLTAQENVALPLVLRGLPHAAAQELALESMRRVGVETLANQPPDELSGGQAQRVSVARVLAIRPRLILADEPTGRLDRHSARQVVDVLLTTADELGAGLVIATHDPHVTAQLPTRWRMRDGSIALVSESAAEDLR